MRKTGIIIVIIIGLILLWGWSIYNGLVKKQEAVAATWSQVENVYQRRAELVPNLVAVVKNYAEYEQETLTAVTEARAKAAASTVDMEHFDETGRLANDELIDREYDSRGYLVRAAMLEKSGGKSRLTYEYDSDGCLVKRTLVNASTGLRSVNEYRYNTSFEIIQQSMKAFTKDNECIVSISMKNDLQERDDNDNWTVNKMNLTYWEKGQRTTIQTVEQRRTISYWDE